MRKLPAGTAARSPTTIAATTMVAAVLCSCAVGPNYQRPVTPVAPQFANVGQPGFNGGDVEARFWTLFNDPKLNRLVEDALKENKDLKEQKDHQKTTEKRTVRRKRYPNQAALGA